MAIGLGGLLYVVAQHSALFKGHPADWSGFTYILGVDCDDAFGGWLHPANAGAGALGAGYVWRFSGSAAVDLPVLKERHHNKRFLAYMDRFIPAWRQRKDELNALPISHSDCEY